MTSAHPQRTAPMRGSAYFPTTNVTGGGRGQGMSNPGSGEQRVFRFPLTKNVLWDPTPTGNAVLLHINENRNISLHVSEATIRLAHRHAQQAETHPYTGFLVGSVTVDSDEEGVTILMDRFDPGRDIPGRSSRLPTAKLPGDFLVPLTVFLGEADISATHSIQDFINSFKVLEVNCSSHNSVDPAQCLSLRVLCRCHSSNDDITFSLHFGAVTMATRFVASPVKSIAIIPTALARNLMGPLSLSDVQGTYKTGFITMDETRKLLLLLETDPKTNTLPLVGIWLSGVTQLSNPVIWSACLRYTKSNGIQERVYSSSGGFLLVLFTRTSRHPLFYECRAKNDQEPRFMLVGCRENLHVFKHASAKGKPPVQMELTQARGGPSKSLFIQALARKAQQDQSVSGPSEQRPTLHRSGTGPKRRGSTPSVPSAVIDDEAHLVPRPSPKPIMEKSPSVMPSVPELSFISDSFSEPSDFTKNGQAQQSMNQKNVIRSFPMNSKERMPRQKQQQKQINQNEYNQESVNQNRAVPKQSRLPKPRPRLQAQSDVPGMRAHKENVHPARKRLQATSTTPPQGENEIRLKGKPQGHHQWHNRPGPLRTVNDANRIGTPKSYDNSEQIITGRPSHREQDSCQDYDRFILPRQQRSANREQFLEQEPSQQSSMSIRNQSSNAVSGPVQHSVKRTLETSRQSVYEESMQSTRISEHSNRSSRNASPHGEKVFPDKAMEKSGDRNMSRSSMRDSPGRHGGLTSLQLSGQDIDTQQAHFQHHVSFPQGHGHPAGSPSTETQVNLPEAVSLQTIPGNLPVHRPTAPEHTSVGKASPLEKPPDQVIAETSIPQEMTELGPGQSAPSGPQSRSRSPGFDSRTMDQLKRQEEMIQQLQDQIKLLLQAQAAQQVAAMPSGLVTPPATPQGPQNLAKPHMSHHSIGASPISPPAGKHGQSSHSSKEFGSTAPQGEKGQHFVPIPQFTAITPGHTITHSPIHQGAVLDRHHTSPDKYIRTQTTFPNGNQQNPQMESDRHSKSNHDASCQPDSKAPRVLTCSMAVNTGESLFWPSPHEGSRPFMASNQHSPPSSNPPSKRSRGESTTDASGRLAIQRSSFLHGTPNISEADDHSQNKQMPGESGIDRVNAADGPAGADNVSVQPSQQWDPNATPERRDPNDSSYSFGADLSSPGLGESASTYARDRRQSSESSSSSDEENTSEDETGGEEAERGGGGREMEEGEVADSSTKGGSRCNMASPSLLYRDEKKFYNNLLGQVQKLLHTDDAGHNAGESDNDQVNDLPRAFPDLSMATLGELEKLGIHLQGSDVTIDERSFYRSLYNVSPDLHPHINYISLADFNFDQTDISMEANAIAMKYLSDGELAKISAGFQGEKTPAKAGGVNPLLRSVLTGIKEESIQMDSGGGRCDASFAVNMSLASRKYMQKYGLLSGGTENGQTPSEPASPENVKTIRPSPIRFFKSPAIARTSLPGHSDGQSKKESKAKPTRLSYGPRDGNDRKDTRDKNVDEGVQEAIVHPKGAEMHPRGVKEKQSGGEGDAINVFGQLKDGKTPGAVKNVERDGRGSDENETKQSHNSTSNILDISKLKQLPKLL